MSEDLDCALLVSSLTVERKDVVSDDSALELSFETHPGELGPRLRKDRWILAIDALIDSSNLEIECWERKQKERSLKALRSTDHRRWTPEERKSIDVLSNEINPVSPSICFSLEDAIEARERDVRTHERRDQSRDTCEFQGYT